MVLVVQNPPANAGDRRDMSSIPGLSAPVSLPGKFHGQRSLVGYIPRGCRESDMTQHTYTHKVPGGPVAKTPHSQGRGLGFHPWSGN